MEGTNSHDGAGNPLAGPVAGPHAGSEGCAETRPGATAPVAKSLSPAAPGDLIAVASDPAQDNRNGRGPAGRTYAALDLGTNNCRLLVARPSRRGFKVVDAFSRIIRLGEGVSATGRLSEPAIERTIDALRVCAAKMDRNKVERAGLIATEACRLACNADEFLARVRRDTGLEIKVVDGETEAKLAVSGCASLIDLSCDFALVFDIGGGSSELIWLDLR